MRADGLADLRALGEPATVLKETKERLAYNGVNGPDGEPKVSSGTIRLNGLEVVHESDFSQQVARIERPLTNVAASNTLEVRLGSQPGGTVTVSVVAV